MDRGLSRFTIFSCTGSLNCVVRGIFRLIWIFEGVGKKLFLIFLRCVLNICRIYNDAVPFTQDFVIFAISLFRDDLAGFY